MRQADNNRPSRNSHLSLVKQEEWHFFKSVERRRQKFRNPRLTLIKGGESRMYVRKSDSDTWHWCTNCSKYPTGSDVIRKYEKPTSAELCSECKAKEQSGNCE